MDEALQESPGGQHHGRSPVSLARCADHAGHVAVQDDQVLGGVGDDCKVRLPGQLCLDGLPIEPPVDLGPWPPHGRALGTVEQAELDSGCVGHAAHQAIECVDLPDQVSLAKAADGGIARHLPDRLDLVGQEQGAGAHARRRCGGLATGVPSSDDYDVV